MVQSSLGTLPAPEYFPFAGHLFRVVASQLERSRCPVANKRIGEHACGRAHRPELFLSILSSQQRLPFAELIAQLDYSESPAEISDQTPERGLRIHVIRGLFAIEFEFPLFYVTIRNNLFKRRRRICLLPIFIFHTDWFGF